MGEKRLKINRGLGDFVPTSINFSEITKDNEYDFNIYEVGDNGYSENKLENEMAYEELIIQTLYNLEKKEKFIFLFQLLRDMGYQIDHGTFAKVLKMSRRQYMRMLNTVRIKGYLVVEGYKEGTKTPCKK